jgi:hypothetical protein
MANMSGLAKRAASEVRSRMVPAIAEARHLLLDGGHVGERNALRTREGAMWDDGAGGMFVRLEQPCDRSPMRVDLLDEGVEDLPAIHALVLHLSVVASSCRSRGASAGNVPYLAFADGPRTIASANILRLEAEATYRRDMRALAATASSVHAELSNEFRLGERTLLFGRDDSRMEISTLASRDPSTRGIYLRTAGEAGWAILTTDWNGARSSIGLHRIGKGTAGFVDALLTGRIPQTPFGMRFGPDMLPPGADVLALCDAASDVVAMTETFGAVRHLVLVDGPDNDMFEVLDERVLGYGSMHGDFRFG